MDYEKIELLKRIRMDSADGDLIGEMFPIAGMCDHLYIEDGYLFITEDHNWHQRFYSFWIYIPIENKKDEILRLGLPFRTIYRMPWLDKDRRNGYETAIACMKKCEELRRVGKVFLGPIEQEIYL